MADWNSPTLFVAAGEYEAIESILPMYRLDGARRLYTTNLSTAEMIKYACNAHLAMRISFINGLADLCDATGANLGSVTAGLEMDPRTGTAVHASLGWGGSCLPKDTAALVAHAKSLGLELPVVEGARRVNQQRIEATASILYEKLGSLAGHTVGILGLAFKPHTDDLRESPSLRLARYILQRGAAVRLYDPVANHDMARFLLDNHPQATCLPTPESVADGCEALVLGCPWEQILGADWEGLAALMVPPRLLVDSQKPIDRMGRHGAFRLRGNRN